MAKDPEIARREEDAVFNCLFTRPSYGVDGFSARGVTARKNLHINDGDVSLKVKEKGRIFRVYNVRSNLLGSAALHQMRH